MVRNPSTVLYQTAPNSANVQMERPTCIIAQLVCISILFLTCVIGLTTQVVPVTITQITSKTVGIMESKQIVELTKVQTKLGMFV